ncbi:MAG: deoxyribose-phosphate aldolase [Candidatus Bathyarchaeia archaeon]
MITKRQLARYIDHTLVRATATVEEVERHCEEARQLGFASVFVNPCYVPLASRLLRGAGIRVGTVIGFPLGATTDQVKAFEARRAIQDGADEVDMVMNIGALRSGDYGLVKRDIEGVVRVARSKGARVKVIIETCFLTDDEKRVASRIAKEAGADYIKTSTGFGPGGATVRDIGIIREEVGDSMGVKASGGIRRAEQALAMIRAGATRIGTSHGVAILESLPSEEERQT